MGIEIPIDFEVVDSLLEAGCSGEEIASHFGIHADTLYNRVNNNFGKMWTAYSAEKKIKGCNLLRAKQYAKALGRCEDGDNTLLIWLGKTRLKQVEHREEIKPADAPTQAVIDSGHENMELKAKLSIAIKEIETLKGAAIANEPETR